MRPSENTAAGGEIFPHFVLWLYRILELEQVAMPFRYKSATVCRTLLFPDYKILGLGFQVNFCITLGCHGVEKSENPCSAL
jgi:hypothetical protein